MIRLCYVPVSTQAATHTMLGKPNKSPIKNRIMNLESRAMEV